MEKNMIGYVTLGTNDFEKATAFYDVLLAEIGAGRMMQEDHIVAWAIAPDRPLISVCKPFDGKQATVGNGTMIALTVDSTEMVDAVYTKAIQLGGTDEGPPGTRMDGFYAGYFRDLDGNKLNVYFMETPVS
jgi:predicted lactoylglutathione lyase